MPIVTEKTAVILGPILPSIIQRFVGGRGAPGDLRGGLAGGAHRVARDAGPHHVPEAWVYPWYTGRCAIARGR